MDRKILKLPFSQNSPPDWICPTCEKGILRIKKNTFFKEEGAASRKDHGSKEWDPEWIRHVYSCTLECTNDQCKEIVFSIGTGSLMAGAISDEDGDGGYTQSYDDFFTPRFFEPPLKLINIPKSCPSSVTTPLHESFLLFFSSPSAASNNVRVAIEELLTELKVKRFRLVDGERRFISLHERITLLPSKFSYLKELIKAIKWLGNAGSHGNGRISKDDVMDLYELTEHILHEIYIPKKKRLTALAKKVNKNKGPVRKNRKPTF